MDIESNIIPFGDSRRLASHHHTPRTRTRNAQPARMIPGRLRPLREGQYSLLHADEATGVPFETLWPLQLAALQKFRIAHAGDLSGWHVRNHEGEVIPLALFFEMMETETEEGGIIA